MKNNIQISEERLNFLPSIFPDLLNGANISSITELPRDNKKILLKYAV